MTSILIIDIFMELAKYGEIEEMNVCDNVGDHLVGNVYVR
jgi:splicing factor U2AF 35 kDa subunit